MADALHTSYIHTYMIRLIAKNQTFFWQHAGLPYLLENARCKNSFAVPVSLAFDALSTAVWSVFTAHKLNFACKLYD